MSIRSMNARSSAVDQRALDELLIETVGETAGIEPVLQPPGTVVKARAHQAMAAAPAIGRGTTQRIVNQLGTVAMLFQLQTTDERTDMRRRREEEQPFAGLSDGRLLHPARRRGVPGAGRGSPHRSAGINCVVVAGRVEISLRRPPGEQQPVADGQEHVVEPFVLLHAAGEVEHASGRLVVGGGREGAPSRNRLSATMIPRAASLGKTRSR